MGDAAQLNLVVVGHQKSAAVGSHEHLAEHPAGLGAHRDVVQVGGIGAEAAGTGHRLVEGGPDAVDPVGGAQLLHLPVVQQLAHHRVLVPQLLQGGGVGAVGTGLGLLLGR